MTNGQRQSLPEKRLVAWLDFVYLVAIIVGAYLLVASVMCVNKCRNDYPWCPIGRDCGEIRR